MPVKIIQPTPSAYAYPLLIKHLLHTPLAFAPEQEITYQGRLRFTYRTLRERIGRLASGLSRLGVETGTTVAVMDWDSHRYLECFFAVPMMGAILQTVNVRLSTEQIAFTLIHAKADVLLLNREFFPLIEQIAPRLTHIRHFILIDDEGTPFNAPVSFSDEYEALLAGSSPGFEFPDFDENAQATVFYSTGTTGAPKGVCFSHRQLVLHTLGLAAHAGGSFAQGRLHRDDVYMPITPMFHVHAWGFPYVATMLGIRQVYPGRYLPATVLRLLREEKVTFSHCVPSILQMLFTHPDCEKTDLRGWKVVVGGSSLTPTLASAALERGVDAFVGYGMSETCPVLSIAHIGKADLRGAPEHQLNLRCKTGLPLPLVDLRVVDAQMNDVAHDGKTTGELIVRSPWLTQTYLDAPEASEELWAGKYLHTQDIGHIDPQGYVKITDRIRDVIKTAGEWTSSLELEAIIQTHESVQEVAVIGLPDEKWGERPLALVVLKPEFEGRITMHELRNAAARMVESSGASRHGVLLQVRFVKALLKTSVGKINKREMRETLDKMV